MRSGDKETPPLCPSSCNGDAGGAGSNQGTHGRGGHFQRRGLCTENGSERVYPAHRPCARKRTDLSATALFQQSQSGRRTRTHLWRVPGGNRRIEAGL